MRLDHNARALLFSSALVFAIACAKPGPSSTEVASSAGAIPAASAVGSIAPPPETMPKNMSSSREPEPPMDFATRCGKVFRDLTAEKSEDGTFRMKRADLLRNVNRALARIEENATFFGPPPTKTTKGELAYVMLGVGKGTSCGLINLDRLVRVGGILLSDPPRRKEIYDSLSVVSRLEVEIERDGKPLTLVYHLQD